MNHLLNIFKAAAKLPEADFPALTLRKSMQGRGVITAEQLGSEMAQAAKARLAAPLEAATKTIKRPLPRTTAQRIGMRKLNALLTLAALLPKKDLIPPVLLKGQARIKGLQAASAAKPVAAPSAAAQAVAAANEPALGGNVQRYLEQSRASKYPVVKGAELMAEAAWNKLAAEMELDDRFYFTFRLAFMNRLAA